jgi:hypothetical protein
MEISEYLRIDKSNLLKIWRGETYGSSCSNGRVYSSATTTMVAEIGIK